MVAGVVNGDWVTAEKEEQRALQLDPNYIDALNDYGWLLTGANRLPEAIALLQHAIALDPFNSALHVTYAAALGGARRYAEAEKEYQRNFELDPQSTVGRISLMLIAEQTREPQSVLNELEERVRARKAATLCNCPSPAGYLRNWDAERMQ